MLECGKDSWCANKIVEDEGWSKIKITDGFPLSDSLLVLPLPLPCRLLPSPTPFAWGEGPSLSMSLAFGRMSIC